MMQGILPILRVETANESMEQMNGSVIAPETPVSPPKNSKNNNNNNNINHNILGHALGSASAPTFSLSTDPEKPST